MESRPVSSRSWLPSFLQKSSSKDHNGSSNERTSLLPSSEEGESYELDEGAHSTFQLLFQEFWILLKGSIPVILAYTLQNSLQTVSVLIVGRLSPEALATAAFSYMFAM
jgi:MATE family multidrug resistance protein